MSLRAKLLEVVSALLPALRTSSKTRVVSGSAVMLSLVAFGAAGVAPMAPDAADLPVKTIVEELAIPDLNAQIASLSPATGQFVAEERIRPGDNLSALLDRLGVNDPEAASFIRRDAGARPLISLRPGRRVQATIDAEGRLLSATALLDGREDSRKLVIRRDGAGFVAEQQEAAFDSRVEMRSGEIRSSLFAATDAAQVPDAVAMQLVEMFSSDIDFASDLRKGDRFQVVYETVWQDGEMVRTGRVLAAEFVNAGKSYQAVWFGRSGADGGYYDLQGKALRKAFLKSPLAFSRVTSGFAMRVHPISGQWKQHKGIDFAATTGTPIRSTGDGTVEFAGNAGGYGNMVVIRHGNLYTTAYAHMSRVAARRGTRVAQGEVIGYVGSTGWSTGPHLHYEFRVNNVALDPNSIVVPHAQSLAGVELQQFRRTANDMGHRFALMSGGSTQLASR